MAAIKKGTRVFIDLSHLTAHDKDSNFTTYKLPQLTGDWPGMPSCAKQMANPASARSTWSVQNKGQIRKSQNFQIVKPDVQSSYYTIAYGHKKT